MLVLHRHSGSRSVSDCRFSSVYKIEFLERQFDVRYAAVMSVGFFTDLFINDFSITSMTAVVVICCFLIDVNM